MKHDWDANPVYESAYVKIDASLSPLVILDYKRPRKITAEEVDLILSVADHHLDRKLPYVAFARLHSGTGVLASLQRRMFADWLEVSGTRLQRENVCTVVVTPEPIFRAVLRVVYRFRSPPIRTLTASDVSSAIDLVRTELEHMGERMTPAMEKALLGLSD